MSIRETVRDAQTEAMTQKLRLTRDNTSTPAQIEENDIRLQSYRAVNAAILAEETGGKTRKDLDEQGIVRIMRGLVKRRQDTAEEYAGLGATARAAREAAEADVINAMLPSRLDEAETRALVHQVINETGAEGKQGLGVVMKAIKPRQDVDASLAASIAREILA